MNCEQRRPGGRLFIFPRSFRNRLVAVLVLVSILPMILVNILSYYHVSRIVKSNVEELTAVNLEQTKRNLSVWIKSYEDLLYQIYTNDGIVELMDRLNRGEELAVTRSQLRNSLQGLFYTKEYLRSITLIADNGMTVFYDQLTPSTMDNSWLKHINVDKELLYQEIASAKDTSLIATHYASTFANQEFYLFHLGHRIVDHRNINKNIGIVLFSIEESLLREILNSGNTSHYRSSFNFIVDDNGRVISYIEKAELSRVIGRPGMTGKELEEACRKFVSETADFLGDHFSLQVTRDEQLGFHIINVSNQERLMAELYRQQQVLAVTILLSLSALTLLILLLTRYLTGSIEQVVSVMKKAGGGELSARVYMNRHMPTEIGIIAGQFNQMLGRVEESIEKEKAAGEKQRQAEIVALEAQINPHFLYNTLDTINWMAIDRDQYEISNAISALAKILRYGIDNSNGIVMIREEAEWLKQYIYLQQTRLKNSFRCEVHIEPGVLEYQIHKMLLQPFIENAILHGFEGVKREHWLLIDIREAAKELKIRIEDNGRGIAGEALLKIRQGLLESADKNHIGMKNAMNRLLMYYGQEADLSIESRLNEGTIVMISIPVKRWEKDENCHSRG